MCFGMLSKVCCKAVCKPFLHSLPSRKKGPVRRNAFIRFLASFTSISILQRRALPMALHFFFISFFRHVLCCFISSYIIYRISDMTGKINVSGLLEAVSCRKTRSSTEFSHFVKAGSGLYIGWQKKAVSPIPRCAPCFIKGTRPPLVH